MGRKGHVGGRYRLVERLGTGGMSVVWRGHDEILGRDVAIKVLASRHAGDGTFRDRLRQEARAAARLRHPHITTILDFGEWSTSGARPVPYVVMELNDGPSVAARLARDGALDWTAAVTMAAQVASALGAAHAQGLVHRDVTPANVMLTSVGAKVVDFGIAAAIGQCDTAPDGSLLGTPAYLAPERLGGGPVSPAADVYALGVLLYRALTARLPWHARDTAAALRAHLYTDPEPLPVRNGLPDPVRELCLRCLAKRPEDRPTAATLALELAALADVPVPLPAQPAQFSGAAQFSGPAQFSGAGQFSGPAQFSGSAQPPATAAPSSPAEPSPSIVAAFRAGLARLPARVSHAALAGRRRLQAVTMTVAMLAVAGLVWSSGREADEVGTPQAAAVGTAVLPSLQHPHCKVRYQVERDSGRDFWARVTVGNIGTDTMSGWTMQFRYPGAQRLIGGTRRASQHGHLVSLRAGPDLAPGESAAVGVRGSYRGSNPLPLAFTVDGQSCRAEVLGAVAIVEPADPGTGAPAEHRATDDTA
ncbi:serine/threonine-protein kinase [Mangrovihabitans endophyticus]|uniref:non-specific serine/threonine protein kinase n=1 Tax=Mangrovihabitans endophyticus TaxID=1751298 RepID=A0A8J3C1I6_9ACTN|nr:serine/threonine-protein kinase [Mangrovihabitans endophyticus]GGK96255.1 hypothetical protein GCM10012284_33070 [Mangrovihabitans endophyticus]